MPSLSDAHRIPFGIHPRALAGVSVVRRPAFRSVVFSLRALPVFTISLWVFGFADARFEPDANRIVQAIAVAASCKAHWMTLFI